MQSFLKQTFDHPSLPTFKAATFENYEFKQCHFKYCQLSLGPDPKKRHIIRNVSIIRCTGDHADFGHALLENVLIDGFKSRMIFIFGAAYKHVTIKGSLDTLILNDIVSNSNPAIQQAFQKANDDFYKSVDWALDITHAHAKDLTLRNFPVHLVRRDPETQILIKRENVVDGRWKSLPYPRGTCRVIIQELLSGNRPSTLYIAGARSKHFKEEMQDIKLLRKEGIAEPD